jgi:pre-mRNA-splicing factor RBM22/SLT11
MDREERLKYAREGRQVAGPRNPGQDAKAITAAGGAEKEESPHSVVVAPPPGTGEVQYSSLSGD